VEATAQEINSDFGIEAKLEKNKQLGYHLQISTKEEKNIRSSKTYTSLGTVQAKVKFTTKELEELSKEYREVAGKYDAKQSTLVEQVTIQPSFINNFSV
jgi:DNA mismatch repair ATPase MutS